MSQLRNTLFTIGTFALAALLLYLALRAVAWADMQAALASADYVWLIPLLFIVLLSHYLRAWRWTLLLDALPQPSATAAPRKTSTLQAFYALMIGYMLNYVLPRVGEVARSVNMAAQARLPVSGVIGTVVVERVLDVVVLLLSLLSVFLLLQSELVAFYEATFSAETTAQLINWAIWGAIGLALLVLAGFAFLRYQAKQSQDSFWQKRVQPLLTVFGEGMLTLLRTPRRAGLLVSTVLIWFCYLWMAYLPFVILHIDSISLLDAWSIMIIGSIGVTIPSPGGTGSYHFITIQALVLLFAIAEADAATYAILTHGAQMVLYILVGFASILLQGASFRGLLQQVRQERG